MPDDVRSALAALLRNKKADLIRGLSNSAGVLIAGMLIVFFIYQGVNLARGTASNSHYLANDISLAVETLEAITSQRAVYNYHEGLKDYKVSLTSSTEISRIDRIEKAETQIARKKGLEYARYISPETISIIKLGEKVGSADGKIRVTELVEGIGPVKRIRIHKERSAVAYMAE
jgi:hypothetical protein